MEDELRQTDANFEDPAGRAPLMGYGWGWKVLEFFFVALIM
jgi:hypothetical protein